MSRTFIDDNYSYFDLESNIMSLKRTRGMGMTEGILRKSKKAIRRSPNQTLELFRTRLIQLRDLRNKLTMIRGVEISNQVNSQITSIQKSLSDLENQFLSFYADRQGAKAVINNVTESPDTTIANNYLAQNFLSQGINQGINPNVVTPVPTEVIYGTMVGGGGIGYAQPTPVQEQPTEEAGSEVVDNMKSEVTDVVKKSKKDNTLIYLGLGVIAILLLIRK